MALVHVAEIATLAGADCYILLPTRYNLRASSRCGALTSEASAFFTAPLPKPLSSVSSFKESKMNNMSTIVLGLLVGLVAPILLGVAMAAAKIVSIGRDTLTIKKALKKTTTIGARVGSTDATATKMPERKRDAEFHPAA